MKNKQIVVLHRGWVVVGDVIREKEEVIVQNAHIIRRWGTTKGLGQLALEGKQEDTILDAAGTVRAHEQSVVLFIDCVPEKWTA